MRFRCEIEMDNAAFTDDDPEVELSRCLAVIARQVSVLTPRGTVRDVNGNTVGRWSIEEETPTTFDPTQGAEG